MEIVASDPALQSANRETLEHLEAICSSPIFVTSKRSQDFLRYIVRETIAGRADEIKERNIAHEVFGKGANFEPGEYSLVRQRAGDVRKRLCEYYQTSPYTKLRIELPVGTYAPKIHLQSEPMPAQSENEPATPTSTVKIVHPNRRTLLRTIGLLGACGGSIGLFRTFYRKESPLERFWRPVWANKVPLLIYVPTLRSDVGSLYDTVGVGPAVTLSQAAKFLTQYHHPYHLRFGSDLTFSQLCEQPSLLLGGFDLEWTERVTKDLRFVPLSGKGTYDRAFVDRRTRQTWRLNWHEETKTLDTDYGLLCRIFDKESRQIIMLAVGTWTYGTQAAASILFKPELFSQLVQGAPDNWEEKSFQAIVRVSVFGTTPSSPQFVTSYFW
jgi:hypothetical protein